ncbi:MAG: sce7725 family protein [Bacteroidetes bacterium]|jgi:hypothetical protein|nr:sce7725 family protein [Bacteroidota bacterium]MBT6686106.1 sce7725 family protein [Bacteroidota bacterium]MBT7143250.1 sce7725 family protein [Bacteroidota bacterium]MBT7493404.1 sce7725 family protein [Bacteroidota bacterium]
MYFPYLRGKQFELIALRELSSLMLKYRDKISPIIEPIKESSTLKSTLKKMIENNINFNIILNPKVGSIENPFDKIVKMLSEQINAYSNFQLAIIVDKKTEQHISNIIEFLKNIQLNNNGITLIHYSEIENNTINKLESQLDIKYNLIYFSKTSRRYYREFKLDTRVSLDDYFKRLAKNADYLDVPVSDFSEEYKYYVEDGFKGFSDFLTIGDNYSESGFLPRAVAIHLSYIDNNKIKVQHFTSDSNQDSSDVGGKFAEALEKLVNWCNANNIDSKGVDIFKGLYASGHFPGLGSVKKISIMNHIEIVLKNI